MSCALSPNAKVWTKWHQERVINNHMGPEFSRNTQNMRYINLVKEIVQDVHQTKLIEWAKHISEQHKKVSRWKKQVLELPCLIKREQDHAVLKADVNC